MTDHRELPADLDPEILAAALGDEEPQTDTARLLWRFPERGPAVRRVLRAVRGYCELVAEERTQSTVTRGEEPPLPPGSVLADFRIVGLLGRGAMGIVYRARQRSLGDREVALKVLPAALVGRDPRFAERFRREARLAANIHHPHLAEVFGVGSDEALPCFAMRLVEGPTLQQVLEHLAAHGGATTLREDARHVGRAVRIVRAVADALAAIHAAGLVHRDVKPANVIMEGAATAGPEALDAQPVLVDFGLLRASGPTDLTGSQTLLGTPAYASPEARLGEDLEPRSDVFSLGATLHDLLTATPPGVRAPASAGMGDVRRHNPRVDARLAAIVAMATDGRRALRYADGAALRDELDRYLRHESLRALPSTAPGRLVLWARRQPAQAMRRLGLTVLLAVVLSLIATAGSAVHEVWMAARRGRVAERSGDLAIAAASWDVVHTRPWSAAALPWLGDERQRARDWWDAQSRLADFRDSLLEAVATLGVDASDDELAARTFERMHMRAHEVLFDPELADERPPMLRFLLRETHQAEPAWRCRQALDTCADLLILEPRALRPVPELRERLFALAFGELRHGPDRSTHHAAVAALAAVGDVDVMEALIGLIGHWDPEVTRLAKTGIQSQWTWLRAHDPQALAAFDVATMRRLTEAVAVDSWRRREARLRRTARMPVPPWESPWMGGDRCVHIRRYLPSLVAGRLCELGTPAMREFLGGASPRCVAELLAAARALRTQFPSCRCDSSTPESMSACRANGVHLAIDSLHYLDYDPRIWHRSVALTTDSRPPWVTSWTPDRTADHAAAVFYTDGRGWGGEPRLSGTAADVHGVGTELVGRELSLPSRLQLLRPGRSRVVLTANVPPEARRAMVSIQVSVATRGTLRERGHVAFRLYVPGTHVDVRFAAGSESGREPLRVPLTGNEFLGRDELDVVLEFTSGNTTAWVRRIGVDWITR